MVRPPRFNARFNARFSARFDPRFDPRFDLRFDPRFDPCFDPCFDPRRKRDNEQYKYTLGFMGYGPEEDLPVVELTYNWGREEGYGKGNAYQWVVLGSSDLSKVRRP